MSLTITQRARLLTEFRALQHAIEHTERQQPINSGAYVQVLERLARYRMKLARCVSESTAGLD